MTQPVVLWKGASADDRNHTTGRQENMASTDASTALRDLARHPEIEAEDAAYFRHAADRLDRQHGESQEEPDELKEIEKLEAVRATRDTIEKSAAAGPELRGRADESARELEISYLKKHSRYWAGESAPLAEQVRKRETGGRWAE